jgi:hypothetical protein
MDLTLIRHHHQAWVLDNVQKNAQSGYDAGFDDDTKIRTCTYGAEHHHQAWVPDNVQKDAQSGYDAGFDDNTKVHTSIYDVRHH